MGDVAAERGGIADLRSGDQVTGFDQSPGVGKSQRVQRDAGDWDGGSDKERVIPLLEESHLPDRSQINQCVDGGMASLFEVEE